MIAAIIIEGCRHKAEAQRRGSYEYDGTAGAGASGLIKVVVSIWHVLVGILSCLADLRKGPKAVEKIERIKFSYAGTNEVS